MARKRIDLGPGADDRIVAMRARGLGPDAIARELGCSRATAARRAKELESGVPAIREAQRSRAVAQIARAQNATRSAKPPRIAAAPNPRIPDDLDNIPDGTPLEQIGRWLKMTEREVEIARMNDDPDMLQRMIARATALLTLQQRSTPMAPPDPNQNPDFVAAAEKARKMLHDRIDAIAREVKP